MQQCRHIKKSSPAAPKVLPLGYSHMPASSWASPPQKMAIPTTTFGVVMSRVWRLYNDKIKVVEAKENRPLSILLSWTKVAIFPRGYSQWTRVAYCVLRRFHWVGLFEFHIGFATLVIGSHGIFDDVVGRKEWMRKSVCVRLPFESAIFWSFDTRSVTVSQANWYYSGA